MEHTQIPTVGYSDKVKASFSGILFGFVMLAAATALLWWNEGNFVATRDALNEAQAITVELSDIRWLDASKDDKLVHAIGAAETDEMVEDPFFEVAANAIRLERVVEYFQWVEETRVETRRKSGGGEEKTTVYTYKQDWVKTPVNSSRFGYPGAPHKYRNTVIADVDDFTVQATNVTFGVYRFPKFLIDSISGSEPFYVELSNEAMDRLNSRMVPAAQQSAPDLQPLPRAILQSTEADGEVGEEQPAPVDTETPRIVHISGSTLYLSLSPESPNIGDIRATFKQTKPTTVSIIAKVNGDTFERFLASNGNTVGRLAMGTHSQENMYGTAHSGNAGMNWIFRIVGICLAYFGIRRLSAPLTTLAGIVPILGGIVGAGTKLVGFLLGTSWSLLVIAVAWVRFRPLVGLVIFGVAAVLIGLICIGGRRNPGRMKESS